jgi:hypothetical protein
MNIDPYLIYNIFSYLEPCRDKLEIIRHTHPAYNKYKLEIEKKERNYTNEVLCHVCKSAFYMDVIDDDYQDYEELLNFLEFVNNIPYFRDRNINTESETNSLRIYDLEQYIKIFKDLSYYLLNGSTHTIPEEYKYNMNNTCIKRKCWLYKKKYIYNDTVYALLLLD